jgi:transposase
VPKSTCASAPARTSRRRTASSCAPYHDLIITKLEQGLSAQRIYQDLVEAQGFSASYWSVRRYVQRLSGRSELPVRRLEVLAGAEAQVDFGTGAPLVDANGKRKKTHVFRIVMSHSRKGYSEATLRQTTDDFLTALENAFRHFGGVPKTLVIDNLKAAVQHPDWFDPELTPKVAAFARHYGTVILPTRPRKPQHKGKIEAGIKYVQNNGLKGRTFKSLAEENQHLAHWEQQIADTRIHGTTKRQVGKLFAEVERPGSPAQSQSRRPCGSRQGVLLRAAGVSGAHGVGALGRSPGARLQSALGTDRLARAA